MTPKRTFAEKLVVRIPYAWLIVFFLVPFLIVLRISLSQPALAQPPYTPLLDLLAGWHGITAFFGALSLDNYALIGSDPLYLLSFVKSVEIAAFSTLLLLVIGYPIAYGITRTPRRVQAVLMTLVMLPFWTAFLIRIYAWMNILQHDGPLNQLLLALHIVSTPPVWLATDTAIYIGIVYSYLPFMVLPLYATLERLDRNLLEASADLGARPWATLTHVMVPLCAPGIRAGAILVFIPCLGAYLTPDLLGGGKSVMIGNLIQNQFTTARDWPFGSAVSLALMVVVMLLLAVFVRRGEEGLL